MAEQKLNIVQNVVVDVQIQSLFQTLIQQTELSEFMFGTVLQQQLIIDCVEDRAEFVLQLDRNKLVNK